MTLTDLTNSADQLLNTLSQYAWLSFGLALGLVIILLLDKLLKRKLSYFGIIPRRLIGLPGIIFSPFLHQDFTHLLFNLFPLIILTNLILMMGWLTYCWVSVLLILMSGVLTWALGRTALHIGASSLILGYWGFLLMSLTGGITITALLSVFICIYYFGNFIFSIIPDATSDGQVSWEGHLFGLISGIALGYEWFLDHGKLLIFLVNKIYSFL